MKIVVIGGTGLIGRGVVERLRAGSHEVVAASPSTGVDSVTGAGVAEALHGTDVVVDVPNSPSFADEAVMEFFQRSTGNLVEEAGRAGVGHYLALSIVGADRMADIGYMRAKVAQEDLVTRSGLPFSVVRATQFFEFIPALADGAANGDVITMSPVLMQPIAAADVSAAVADVAVEAAANRITELAGPEQLRLADLARTILAARGDTRQVVADPGAGYFGGTVDDASLIPGQNPAIVDLRLGETRLADWLARSED